MSDVLTEPHSTRPRFGDRRVVVTGIGAVTPLGLDFASTWSAMLEGRSGAAKIARFDATKFPVQIAAEVKDFDPEQFIPRRDLKAMGRFTAFAVIAADEAFRDAGLTLTEHEAERAGCIVGVGLGGFDTLQQTEIVIRERGPDRLSPYSIPSIIQNLAAGHVALNHGLKGPSFCTASACSTGAHAIGEAAFWIRRGEADVMVAGGAEAVITEVGLTGFHAMRVLSRRNDQPEEASRPFDRDRDGFVCGEGAAVLILEALEHAHARGARIYAELLGYGASTDAYHSVRPEPEGRGLSRAMRMALDDAGLPPSSIDYVNAHAPSTVLGDRAELRALCDVFGAPGRGTSPWVSATKSMTGHLLGAAGALEAAVTVQSIREGLVTPTINLHQAEGDFDFVANEPRRRPIRHAISNSFGFGGANAALAFGRS